MDRADFWPDLQPPTFLEGIAEDWTDLSRRQKRVKFRWLRFELYFNWRAGAKKRQGKSQSPRSDAGGYLRFSKDKKVVLVCLL